MDASSYSHLFALPPILNPLLAIPAAPPLNSLLHLQSFQTSVVRNSYSPCWVGAFDFTGIPAAPGGKGQELCVSLMHYNTLTPNCPIGTVAQHPSILVDFLLALMSARQSSSPSPCARCPWWRILCWKGQRQRGR